MKPKTQAQLKKQLDKIFSEYIRRRDKGVCFTCGNKKEWKYQQCGHWITRARLATRYSDKNCNCQCVACNMFKGGNMDEYAVRLVRKYGEGILEELNEQKYQMVKFSSADYEEMIKHFKQRIKTL